MGDAKPKAVEMSVHLSAGDSSAHPRATNYTNVSVAQGIAYIDYGFIEPVALGAIARSAKDGQAPKGINGQLVARVAMGVDVLARLHQQISQVLAGVQKARQPKPKA